MAIKPLRKKDQAKVVKTSMFKGVTRRHHNSHGNPPKSKPWEVQLRIDGRIVYIGSYATEEEAAIVADRAYRERDAGILKVAPKKQMANHSIVQARKGAK